MTILIVIEIYFETVLCSHFVGLAIPMPVVTYARLLVGGGLPHLNSTLVSH